jgi:phosphoglycerate dehydrogenase-like enzyme
MLTVVICSYFEEEYIASIHKVDARLQVLYREDLVPPPRWPGDHVGLRGWRRSEEGEEEFLAMLKEAEVLYDFPRGHAKDLLQVAPKLRWIQASFAGVGDVIELAGLQDTDVIITRASGVYSGPLAEFAMMALLAHVKDLDRLQRDKADKRWRQAHTDTLYGKTLCVVGMGSIGRAVAVRARSFGVHVVGVKRTVQKDDAAWAYADKLYTTLDLHVALREADYVVVTLPSTPETYRLLDAEAISAMKYGAYFVNVGRGQVVDEGALVEALKSGYLSGAALDVFEEEPLPEDSPLWDLGNVTISPHSTASVPELTNELQAELFRNNLRRYLNGKPLINVLNKKLRY